MDCVVPLRLQRTQRIDFRTDYALGLASLLSHLHIDRPNPAVLEKAAAEDAQRELAWHARDAEAHRLKEIAERKQQEESDRVAADESARRQKEAAERQAREAESQRSKEIADPQARQQREEAENRNRQEERIRIGQEAEQTKPLSAWQEQEELDGPRHQLWALVSGRLPLAISAALVVVVLIVTGVVYAYHSLSDQPSRNEPSAHNAQQTNQPTGSPQPAGPIAAMNQVSAAAIHPPTVPGTKTVAAPLEKDQPAAKASAPPRDLSSAPPPASADVSTSNDPTALYNACNRGDFKSCTSLGRFYQFSDPAKAARFYTDACDGGNSAGCRNLAILNEFGNGVPYNPGEAKLLYEKACQLGEHQACSELKRACQLGDQSTCSWLTQLGYQ